MALRSFIPAPVCVARLRSMEVQLRWNKSFYLFKGLKKTLLPTQRLLQEGTQKPQLLNIETCFFVIKPTRCTSFKNLFWHMLLLESCLQTCITYRVSQEECARLREGVPYIKVYRYNPKHLCPKLNGYGDNGQRSLKLWQLLHTYWLPNTY